MTVDIIGFPNAPRLKDLPYRYGEERRFTSALAIIEPENQKHELVKKGTQGLLESTWSRAKNTHSNEPETPYPFPKDRKDQHNIDDRVVRLSTLYKLKSGPNKGKYLGSNCFDFSKYWKTPTTGETEGQPYANQRYISSEAPYDGADFYRMVIATNTRVMVSLSNAKDERIAQHIQEYHKMSEKEQLRCQRGGISAELHHLNDKQKQTVECDGYTVRFISQTPPEDVTAIVVKTYEVVPTKGKAYHLKHIIYPNWVQYGGSGQKGPLGIVEHINDAQVELFKRDGKGYKREEFGIAVNCVYGCGRTNTVILMHHMEKMVMDLIKKRQKKRGVKRLQALETLEYELRLGLTSDVIVDARGMRRAIAAETISKAASKQLGELEAFPLQVVLRELLLEKKA